MWTNKALKRRPFQPLKVSVLSVLLLSFLLWCPFVFLPTTCSAEEATTTETYRITEAELSRLDEIFNQLQILNDQQAKQLTESRDDLTETTSQLHMYQTQLNQCLTELAKLKADLKQSKAELTTAKQQLDLSQGSLQTANALLAQYDKEEKARIDAYNKKIKSLNREANLLKVGLGGALVALLL